MPKVWQKLSISEGLLDVEQQRLSFDRGRWHAHLAGWSNERNLENFHIFPISRYQILSHSTFNHYFMLESALPEQNTFVMKKEGILLKRRKAFEGAPTVRRKLSLFVAAFALIRNSNFRKTNHNNCERFASKMWEECVRKQNIKNDFLSKQNSLSSSPHQLTMWIFRESQWVVIIHIAL